MMLLLKKIILVIWFIIIILLSLKFDGLGDQDLDLFTSWSEVITSVPLRQDGQHEDKSSIIRKSTKVKALKSSPDFWPS